MSEERDAHSLRTLQSTANSAPKESKHPEPVDVRRTLPRCGADHRIREFVG